MLPLTLFLAHLHRPAVLSPRATCVLLEQTEACLSAPLPGPVV